MSATPIHGFPLIEALLVHNGWVCLDVFFVTKFQLPGCNRFYDVYSAMVVNKLIGPHQQWIIEGDGQTNAVPFDAAECVTSAVAFHVGKLVVDGFLCVIDGQHAGTGTNNLP